MTSYAEFLDRKRPKDDMHGFEPTFMPSDLFDFQRDLVTWAVRKGRAAIFADCGMGKTAMQLAWAKNVADHTDGTVLVLAPLAVASQTVREALKFGSTMSCWLDRMRTSDQPGSSSPTTR